MKKFFQKVSKFTKRFRLLISTVGIAIVGGICGFFFDAHIKERGDEERCRDTLMPIKYYHI